MISHFSSNVVLSKARAMYGKRLKSKDYSALLNCRNVNEITAFLKSKTNYSESLYEVNENTTHRGHLEVLLRRKFFYDSALLCRYEMSTGQHFSDYLISSFEIQQIMHSLMFLTSGEASKYIYFMPMFFSKHTHIDLMALSKMKNYDDFLSSISKSKYKNMLEPFKPVSSDAIELPMIEHSLYSGLYEKLFYIIETYSKGSEKKELLNMINICVDIRNFVTILRLKKYYHSDDDYIKQSIFKFGTLKQSTIGKMIAAANEDKIVKIMKFTKAGHKIGKIDFEYIDEVYDETLFNISRRNLRFSVNSAVVMLSYIFLLDIEISNITKIIEGVRYGISSDQINKMIVYRKE